LGKGHITSKCPTKKTTIFKENGEITNESFNSKSSSREENKEAEEEIPEGELLIVKRMFGGVTKGNEGSQRENNFHSWWRKNVFMDNRWRKPQNVVYTKSVNKMNLETKPHPKPYKLKRLSEEG